MSWLFVLHKLRWYVRWPIKWAVFAVTVLLVCFPYPNILVRHVQHWRNPNALVRPDTPGIVEMVEELRLRIKPELTDPEVLKIVERFVYEKIDYAWDWETWGTVDYLPTLDEALEMGREDCDGRAVVAASVLRHLGYEADLVTDFTHVWVKTDKGETMGPRKIKAIIATDTGLKVQRGALAEVPQAVGYGLAVFPLMRELIVLAVLWWLLLAPKGGKGCAIAALVLLVNGLIFLRIGGADHRDPKEWIQLVGLANLLAAVIALSVWARHNARRAVRAEV